MAVSPDVARRAALDEALWTYDDDSFLPHGQAEAEGLDPQAQPILISADMDNLNGAHVALLMDGADTAVDAHFARCMVMFDDGDAVARAQARIQYKRAKDADHVARYFQQKGRGWQEVGQ